MKKVVVVSGANGFIGSALVRKLIEKKFNVHALVSSKSSLSRLKDVEGEISIHRGLLENKKNLSSFMTTIKPYGIFHLATYGSYPFQQDIHKMINTNIIGTLNFLESLKEVKYKQLVVAGSSSEYGKKDGLMKESDLLMPNNYYAATKVNQTHLCQVYSQASHKPLVILRLFNVYGPYEEKGRLVRSVIDSALAKKPILLASGSEARDLVYVEDVVDVFMHILKQRQFFGEIFNIGTGRQTTIKELAQTVVRLTKSKSEIKLNTYKGRPWDSNHWQADMRKTKTVLNWSPKFTLRQGLQKTIRWYKVYGKKYN